MDGSTTFDQRAIAEYDDWCDADKDLFGEPVVAELPESSKVDIFKVDDGGFDRSERNLIASEMIERVKFDYSDRRRDRILAEADRFARCGIEGMKIYCRDCWSQFYIRTSCRSRICPTCAAVYAKKLQKTIKPVLGRAMATRRRGYRLSLLTLTVTSRRFGDALPTRDAIKRLYRETSSFLRLNYGKYSARYSKSGKVVENRKRYVGAGWFAVLEFGSDNNNAHCHIVTYGPIRQWHKLVSAWEKITADSRGVDIRVIHRPDAAVRYVLKYISKPPATDSYIRLVDYVLAIKGTRRVRSGGIFYNRFTLRRPEGLPFHCAVCGGKLIPDGTVDLTANVIIPSLYDKLRALVDGPQGPQSAQLTAISDKKPATVAGAGPLLDVCPAKRPPATMADGWQLSLAF